MVLGQSWAGQHCIFGEKPGAERKAECRRRHAKHSILPRLALAHSHTPPEQKHRTTNVDDAAAEADSEDEPGAAALESREGISSATPEDLAPKAM